MGGPPESIDLAALTPTAQDGEPLQTWFDDPFFQLSNAVPDCPVPAGPFTDEADRRVQAHHCADKGTTYWLAGDSEKPDAVLYDR